MNKIALIFTTCALLGFIVSNAQKTIIDDPNAEKRSIDNFSAISISGGIDLYLSQGDEDGIAVSSSDAKNIEHIKTNVENGVLKIWYHSDGWRSRSGNKKMVAYVSFKSLKRITAAGASDIYVSGNLKQDALDIRLSGASDFKGSIETGKLNIVQSGASDATITGRVSQLEVEVSGASNFKGYGLETESCNAKASGASDIKITVNKELYAVASGASSIYYKGSGVPKELRSSGASNVTKK